jgi:hypothetical protein
VGLLHALRPLFARRMAGAESHSAYGMPKCALPKSGLPTLRFQPFNLRQESTRKRRPA